MNSIPGLISLFESHSENRLSRIELAKMPCATLIKRNKINRNDKIFGKKLIFKGPYQYVRHPLYAAFIWSGTGIISMVYKSWLLLIFIIPIHIFWVWHIQKEEKFLLNQFGQEYEQYMMRTPQFFPKYISSKEVE